MNEKNLKRYRDIVYGYDERYRITMSMVLQNAIAMDFLKEKGMDKEFDEYIQRVFAEMEKRGWVIIAPIKKNNNED